MNSQEKYIIARWAYAIGEEYITDIEYDHLESEMKANNLLSEYTSRGWSEDPIPTELLKKYKLDEFIVPVTFTHSTESIESLNTVELVRSKLFKVCIPTRISYKLDGWSLRLNYYNGKLVSAITRNRNGGKGKNLESIIKLFKPTIDIMGKVLVTGELYLKNNRFEEYKVLRGIVSQRNGVSTAIANGDIEFLGYRCFNIYLNDAEGVKSDKYEFLQSLGFSVPKSVVVKDYQGIMKAIEILGKQKSIYDGPTDGVVLENDTMQFALRIGAWEEQCNKSYVLGYEFNRGMYGNSISIAIKPMFINHKTVSSVDVTNPQTIIDYGLDIGTPIAFVERSGVNSVFDSTATEKLHQGYRNRLEEYRKEIDANVQE